MKDEPLPSEKPKPDVAKRGSSLLSRIPVGTILSSYAKRRGWEAKTKALQAQTGFVRSIEDFNVAYYDWQKIEAKLDNLEGMKQTVKNTVTTELQRSELLVKQANADLEIHDLEHDVRISELKAKKAQADLRTKKAEEALNKPAKESSSRSREQILDDLHKEILELQEEFELRKKEAGGELSEAEHAHFVKREAIIIRKIKEIEETPER